VGSAGQHGKRMRMTEEQYSSMPKGVLVEHVLAKASGSIVLVQTCSGVWGRGARKGCDGRAERSKLQLSNLRKAVHSVSVGVVSVGLAAASGSDPQAVMETPKCTRQCSM
jgi:hypothetical protein